jgi:hypothetical protein
MKKRDITQRSSKQGRAMSEPQEKPEAANQPSTPTPNPADAVKPFQDASIKYMQAAMAAHQNAWKDSVQAQLAILQTVQKIQREAYDAVVEATRQHMRRMSEQPSASAEETYRTRIQAQINYENEVRQVYTNSQQRIQETLKMFGAEGGGDFGLTSQKQDVYRQYLSDLQQAWSGMKDLDPQTIKTIATSILYTLNMA